MTKEFDYRKYLRKNPPLRPVEGGGAPFDLAVVIPVFDDRESVKKALTSVFAAELPPGKKMAVFVVVNNPPGAAPEKIAGNQVLLEELRKTPRPDLYVIDASSRPIENGVGQARKLGMDEALRQIGFAGLGNGILFSLDADTLVSGNYFTAAADFFDNHPECGAAVFGFRHQPGKTAELQRAIDGYETYIHDYSDGLKKAGSPYAYYSIGSAFAVRAETYLKAGGMREKPAGEDFYFLQAARKCGAVGMVGEVTVSPEARISDRVPFGTGQTLAENLAGGRVRNAGEFDFAALKRVLDAAAGIGSDPEVFLAQLAPAARQFFVGRGFPAAWRSIGANGGILKDPFAFHRWFDALKTLQFLKAVSGSTR